MQSRVSSDVVVEQTHTTLELLLRTLLGPHRVKSSFAGMVDQAVSRGYLSEQAAVNVNRLKDVRREAKHRGQQPDAKEAERLVQACVATIQTLLARIRAT